MESSVGDFYMLDDDGEASWLKLDASSAISSWTHRRSVREQNKSLRRVYEEAEMVYGRDVHDHEELRERVTAALGVRRGQVGAVVKQMQEARSLDLCFLVDVTASMGPHILAVKDSIRTIVDTLLKEEADEGREVRSSITSLRSTKSSIVKKVRLAFVGYRDFFGPWDTVTSFKQFEMLDFTDSVDAFHQFCGNLTASGGDDSPEDVFGGLEKAIALNWSTDGSSRMLFHIADAPCHGREFHNSMGDRFPNGDPSARTLLQLLGPLAENGVHYHFGKINELTDRMVQKFAEAYDGEFVVCDFKNPNRMVDNIVSTASIAVTRVGSSAFGTSRTKLRDQLGDMCIDEKVPDWTGLPIIDGLLLSCEFQSSLEDIIAGVPWKQKPPMKARVQLALQPFAFGAERVAYYGNDVTCPEKPVDIVLKKYTAGGVSRGFLSSAVHYECAIQLQTIAAYLADKFNEELVAKTGQCYEIKFLKTQLLSFVDSKTKERVYMCCEKRYPPGHQYLRFTNNMDYSMLELTAKLNGVDVAFIDQLMAFSHWTYQVSGGKLMVVDLQGIISGGGTIELTDPAIHCTDLLRYGRTNLGEKGMASFFSRHQCTAVCKKMGLTMPANFSL